MFRLLSTIIISLWTITPTLVQGASHTVREPTKAELAAAKAALEDKLKDPDSLRMRKMMVKVDANNNPTTMCGEANAKNSYGGYVGYATFIVFMEKENGTIKAFGTIDDADLSNAQMMCSHAGIEIR